MISIFKTVGEELKKIEDINFSDSGYWINMVNPSDAELSLISKKFEVPMEFLRSALDEEETSRIDIEDGNTLIILDIPFTDMEDNSLVYDTYPFAIIHTKLAIITVCLKDSKIINDFVVGKIKSFYTFKRSRFILQIIYRIASFYLIYLRQIDKKSTLIQNRLQKSMKNRELIQLLSLEKSLVYFSTSLKSNEVTLEKMLKMELMQKYPEDQDVLEDVIIENKQAIEMASIYSDVLSGTMDAFASVISNNLNIVMKLLASITIVMSIPTMISGLFGMNVSGIPFSSQPNAFWIVVSITMIVATIVTIYLYRKDMF